MDEFKTREEMPPREVMREQSLIAIGIPRKFFTTEIEDFEIKNIRDFALRYVDNLHEMFYNCVNLLFNGTNGGGKSLLACLILKSAYRRYYTAKIITFSSFVNLILNREEEKVYNIRNAEFLVIDELGKETDAKNGFNINCLVELLKYREQQGFPTIVCTNLNMQDLEGRYGTTIASIFNEFIKLEFTGSDRRKEVLRRNKGVDILLGGE